MKKFKLKIILLFVCALLFNRTSIVYAQCEDNNMSNEEVYLILAADEKSDASMQIPTIIDDELPEQRASKTKIGLGYGTDWLKGDFIEIRVTGVSTGLVTIKLKLTVYHVSEGENRYFTDHDVSFYQAVLYDQSQRFYFNDWISAGIKGGAYFSNGTREDIPFTMIVNGQ